MTEQTTTETSRINYTVGDEAWYHSTAIDREPELRIGRDAYIDGREDGCLWEFTVVARTFTGMARDHHAVQVQVFDDAFQAFADPDMGPFFAGLADLGTDATLSDVRALCDRIGFTDGTDRTSPYL